MTSLATTLDGATSGAPTTTAPPASPTPTGIQAYDPPQPCPLDLAPPLDRDKFPNPPSGRKPPASTIPNVRHLLDRYDITARYNVIKKKLLVTMPGHRGSSDNFDNVALTRITSLATLNGMNTGPIPAIVYALGDQNLYNPVADWIHSHPWDGTSRMPEVFATLVERDGYPQLLKEALIRRWLLSAVAAALTPNGFTCRGVLTLQGPQGIGKTKWTKALISDPALADDVIKLDLHLDPGNKDSQLSAIVHWIAEIGELDGSLRRDIARLKGFLTADRDKVRRPYAAVESEYARRTVFCATVNDANFLVDPTGNTRWWTIPVTSIDYEHGIDMQQVFAELAVSFQAGEQWWLTRDEEQLLEEQNRDHRSISAIEGRIRDWFDLHQRDGCEMRPKTPTEFLQMLGIDHPSNPQCKECAAVLREICGDSTRSKGRDRWRIPVSDPSIGPDLQDDDDLY
jgi:predicted P-loop ATPase